MAKNIMGKIMGSVLAAVFVFTLCLSGCGKQETVFEDSLIGFHGGYFFIPAGSEIYRYSAVTSDLSGITKGKLLLKCVEENQFGDDYNWEFYAIKEYPDYQRILGIGPETFIFEYYPPIGVGEEEIESLKDFDMVVMENGSVIHGKSDWLAFYDMVTEGKSASIDLAYCYRSDGSHMSKDLWEATKYDYPSAFYSRLSYDGEMFTVEPLHKDGDEFVVKYVEGYDSPTESYKYLMHYYGDARYDFALFTYYDKYVLTNDDTVTWFDIEDSTLSARLDAYIPHIEVYCEYTWK